MRGLDGAELTLFFTKGNGLATWEQGGMLARELAIYRELARDLDRVRFVTYGRGDPRTVEADGAEIDVVGNRWRLPGRLHEWAIRHLHPRRWSPRGVVKTNQLRGARDALAAAETGGLPCLVRCGYPYLDFAIRREGEDSPQARRARELEAEAFARADRVALTTERMRRRALERHDLDPGKVHVVPNYVETDVFAPDPDIEPEPGRVCFVGRLAPQKNPLTLLEAIEGLDVSLDLVGTGPLGDRARACARDKDLDVTFHGNVDHRRLPALFNRAEAVVLPSDYEGHPKVLLEAMACARPVVATDVPGIRAHVDHGRTGWLVEPEAGALGEGLEQVLGHPDRRAKLGRNAREFAQATVSLEVVAERERAVHEELLAEGA